MKLRYLILLLPLCGCAGTANSLFGTGPGAADVSAKHTPASVCADWNAHGALDVASISGSCTDTKPDGSSHTETVNATGVSPGAALTSALAAQTQTMQQLMQALAPLLAAAGLAAKAAVVAPMVP